MQNQKITPRELEAYLFKAADILRGKMDAAKYKKYYLWYVISQTWFRGSLYEVWVL